MSFYDLICLFSHGTLIRILDQNLKTLYFGRVGELTSDTLDNIVIYNKLFTRSKVVSIFHNEDICIVVYLPY